MVNFTNGEKSLGMRLMSTYNHYQTMSALTQMVKDIPLSSFESTEVSGSGFHKFDCLLKDFSVKHSDTGMEFVLVLTTLSTCQCGCMRCVYIYDVIHLYCWCDKTLFHL